MGRFFFNLQKGISKHQWLFAFLLVIFILWALFAVNKLKLSENASLILPHSENQDQLGEILQNVSFSERIFFNISLADSSQNNPDELVSYARKLVDKLDEKKKDEIKSIRLQVQDKDIDEISDYVLRNLPFLLDSSDYQEFDKLIADEQLDRNFKKKYQTLLSPASVFLKKIILKDPVGLSNKALLRLRSFQLDQSLQIKNNYLFTQDQKHLVFYLVPNQPASETKKNSSLVNLIKASIEEQRSDFPSVKAEFFGAPVVAVGNAQQIKRDIVLTVSMALLAVIFLIAFFYRSKRLYLIIFLPASLAVLTSMAILYLMKGEISAIALGMGSVLVGISIDYVLHIFTHFQKGGSIKQTLQDVSEPIIISAATTATAFFGLLIVSAPALQDMGLFAGLSILFSAIFTLILIPLFLKKPLAVRKKQREKSMLHTWVERIVDYPYYQNKYLLIAIVVLSPILFYYSHSVVFQGDMNTINYMDASTKQAEDHLNKITKLSQRNIFLVTADTCLQSALSKIESLEKRIDILQKDSLVLKYTSIQALLPSKQLQKEKIARWDRYWTPKKKQGLLNHLALLEQKYHFKPASFAGFQQMLNQEFKYISPNDERMICKSVLAELIQPTDDQYLVLTQIKTTTANKPILHHILESKLDTQMYMIDKEYLTTKFVNDLRKDFQKLVQISLLLVFLIIWMSFGRIELAVITYIPLLLSWMWTLGAMSLFGLEFNIVNIIITTFIFGLGIDYSIFISRGLIQKYKYGYQNDTSFKISILFSAITTLLGVGVLVFAKHPALRSMAAVTVIGLGSVLLLSFILQPLMFNWLAYVKADKKRLVPITGLNIFVSLIAIFIFSLGSLINTIAGFILISMLGGNSKKARLIFHHFLRASSWVMIFIMFNVKKKIKGWEHTKFRKPAVIISNHQSHIDIMLMLMLHPKIIILTNDWVQHNFFYGKIVKQADFYPILDHLQEHIELLREKKKDGYSIMIFPEGTRSVDGRIGRFHKGAFYLAEQLDLDVLPILLHGPGDCITKGEAYLKSGRIDMEIGERIPSSDTHYGVGYVERSKAFRKMYREWYQRVHEEVVSPDYLRKRVELNYIYKGPVLEWYGKIKMNFEKNYQFFHEQIPQDAKIVDLGCGNGFLDYMLVFLANNRQIVGVDFDEDKILTALNCNGYQQFPEGQIAFYASDLMSWEYQHADVYVIMDTLHYLPEYEQEFVLQQAVHHLNSQGKIIIRDADSDLAKKHRGTKFSEWQSTKVFGFNKTKNDDKQLYFSSAKKTQAVLEGLGLQVEVVDHTKMNSNVILIGRKM
jgi:1-acyl-sn-glycerol-3-phosphate acyltransferase